MRIGIHVDSRDASTLSFVDRARAAEELGFDIAFVSDRVVAPVELKTPYPYTKDGVFGAGANAWWMDSVVSMAFIAAATSRIEVGPGVMVLPLREPLLLSKQLATIDVVSGGRVLLGIGAGWMREEFEAVGSEFSDRGRRTDEYIKVLRDAWSGNLAGPPGLNMIPVPAHRIPIVIGGTSRAALLRAGRLGDGWYTPGGAPEVEQIAASMAQMQAAAEAAGRDPATLRTIVSLGRVQGDPVPVAAALASIGAGEVVLRRDVLDEPNVEEIVRRIHEL